MATTTSCADRALMVKWLVKCLVWIPLAAASAAAGAASTQTPPPSSPQFHYLLHCGGCHIEDGSGMAGVVPDLKVDMGFFALSEEGRSYLVRVPGSAHSPLSDRELADVLNWMLSTFAASDSPQPYTEAEVTANRRIPMLDAPAVRKELLQQRTQSQTSAIAEPLSASQLSAVQQEAFGAALFFDTSLSRHNNQSCASCHDPARAFSDARQVAVLAGASLGSDGHTIGQRNAPALTYVAFTPALSLNDSHSIVSGSTLDTISQRTPADAVRGGLFWDGREATLEAQVLTPFIDEREMALTDLQELAGRVMNNASYRDYLGASRDQNEVLTQIASALAAYLRSDALNSFDSRYDRYLRGEVKPTREEMIGMGLFFSPGFTSCATCHQAESAGYAHREVFTNHRYENIGTPINRHLLGKNGLGENFRDAGLANNPIVNTALEHADLAGRIKVPSLRNIAVTGPYMHNGVFRDLTTLMVFYNHFNQTGNSGLINPETEQPWEPSAYPEGVATQKLLSGFPLSERQLAALTSFLKMLTDQRYEHLM
jgi:cytochrome c peroxidase